MSTNDEKRVMTWYRVIDKTGNNKPPVDTRAESESAACIKIARQWFGELPGCIMDAILDKITAVPYTDDGKITRIEGMVGLSGKYCLPGGYVAPSDLRRRNEKSEPDVIELSEKDSQSFADALLNLPEPNQATIDAIRRYKERTQKPESE